MHVTALAPPSVSRCSVTLSGGPSDARFFNGAGGIRTHGLELMRLARTAPPLPREVWLAGVEPAISGAQNRRDGLSPTARGAGRDPGGAGRSTTVESNHASPPYQSGACPVSLSSVRPKERYVRRCDPAATAAGFRALRDRKSRASGLPILRTTQASPGNRTLLAGITARGLASSR